MVLFSGGVSNKLSVLYFFSLCWCIATPKNLKLDVLCFGEAPTTIAKIHLISLFMELIGEFIHSIAPLIYDQDPFTEC